MTIIVSGPPATLYGRAAPAVGVLDDVGPTSSKAIDDTDYYLLVMCHQRTAIPSAVDPHSVERAAARGAMSSGP